MRLLVDLQCIQSAARGGNPETGMDLLAALAGRRGEDDRLTVLLRETEQPVDLLRVREALRHLVAGEDIVVVPRVDPVGDGHDHERALAAREVLIAAGEPDAVVLVEPQPDGGDPRWSVGRYLETPPTFVISAGPLPGDLLEPSVLGLVGIGPGEAAMKVWGAAHHPVESKAPLTPPTVTRSPTLALVSPWPPTRSGVADLAASTLPHLQAHYNVTVVTDNPELDHEVRRLSRDDFRREWWRFDRVLYHLGNNAHHAADLELLGEAPGALVVHDAVLSGAIRSVTGAFGHPGGVDSLLAWDGAAPADEELDLRGTRAALAPALGMLVHSRHARHLLRTAGVRTEPLRVSPLPVTRLRDGSSRPPGEHPLGVPVLAHFGFVNAFKGAEELVAAAASLIGGGTSCRVVFVGEFLDRRLRRKVVERAATLGVPLEITGYVTPAEWTRWLDHAACAVQLRQQSHGESSAALGELIAAGLPVVCTDLGSFAELPEGVVRHVPPGASGDEIAHVVAQVLDPSAAEQQARASRAYVKQALSPLEWADAVASMVEQSYTRHPGLLWAAATAGLPAGPAPDLHGRVFRRTAPAVWLSDTSVYAHTPFFSGIQRATLALHTELLRGDEAGRRLLFPTRLVDEPPDEPHLALAGDGLLSRVRMPIGEADWLLCLDLDVRLARIRDELLAARARGLRVAVNIYDLMPVLHPEWFPRESGPDGFAAWFRVMLETADLVLVNSLSTAQDVKEWVERHPPQREDSFELALLRLGSEFAAEGMSQPREPRSPSHFLMVGTVEPRKGHAAVLDAFEQMWASGSQARLTVMGRGGWMVQDLVRRMSRLQRDDDRFRRVEDADDQELQAMYAGCTAVIMASEGEGFGLPIIEAAAHACPVVARDLPVFREVAGDTATYFRTDGSDLVPVLGAVQECARNGALPLPSTEHVRPWRDVAATLTGLLDGHQPALDMWSPGGQGWRSRAASG